MRCANFGAMLLPVLVLVASSVASAGDDHGGHSPGGELRQGRYTGELQLRDRRERIAVTADFFMESPEDFTRFPRLNAILKLSLGGYHTHEYVTEVFKDIRYDFDRGVLTLDEPSNDLVISAEVHSRGGRTHLAGQVWMRSVAQPATLSLELLTDEPPDEDEPGDSPGHDHAPSSAELPFVPLLDGQYLGTCDGKESIFQIQTVKGLRKNEPGEGKDLFDYEIVGRLGHRSEVEPRPGTRPWQVRANFAGGSYHFATGRLIFLGPSTTAIECHVSGPQLMCRYRVQGAHKSCEFRKEPARPARPVFFARQHHVRPTAEQMRELPTAQPPANEALASAVSGEFLGYLHHEATNLYQVVRLQVVPSSSTDNPHNPNRLNVSTTAVLHFGRGLSPDFLAQRYEPRSFYLRPGFTLNAPGTDSFISIEEWRQGYIRGVWYSHGFGRVGTVELIKGSLPSLPASAAVVQGWTGEFAGEPWIGPGDGSAGKSSRWFHLILPNRSSERLDSTVSFVGSYQSLGSLTAIRPIERGRYDPYTGALGWILDENGGISIVSGSVLPSEGSLALHWPPAPNVFSAQMGDYLPETYRKENEL